MLFLVLRCLCMAKALKNMTHMLVLLNINEFYVLFFLIHFMERDLNSVYFFGVCNSYVLLCFCVAACRFVVFVWFELCCAL